MNEMELVHAIACQTLKEIHTISKEVATENAKLAKIVTVNCRVYDTNVLILASEYVAIWPCVMYQIIFQRVRAPMASLVIHSCNAMQFRLYRLSHRIHALHHLVDRIVIVVTTLDNRCAHVHQVMLALHRNAGQNVLCHPNARPTKLVSTPDVRIHARIRVASVLFVMPAIIIQYALVHLVLRVIRLRSASELVSLHLHFIAEIIQE